ncbi:MAG: 50S ribosomal protein L18 [Planctomycetes bacterium]|nr:50S ribosomal protein L18 [Planctomycetota bacterium]
MKALLLKNQQRLRRRRSVRRKLRQHTTLPRLSVNRTLKHFSAQVIDDAQGKTLASVTSTSKSIAGDLSGKTKSQKAAFLGAELARRAQAAGVTSVAFDRGHCRYHGRVKAFADAAREGGLKF